MNISKSQQNCKLFNTKQIASLKKIMHTTNTQLQQIRKQKLTIKNDKKINTLEIMNRIQNQYAFLLDCIQISFNKIRTISLQAYQQAYFVVDIKMFVLPIKIYITKIANQGTLYVGFNKQYPGLRQSKVKSSNQLDQIKFIIKKPQIIEIKQPININVQKMYLMFVSTKLSLNLSFKLTEFNANQQQSQIQTNKFVRTKIFSKTFNYDGYKQDYPRRKIRVKTQAQAKFSMTKSFYLTKFQLINKMSPLNFLKTSSSNMFKLSKPNNISNESNFPQNKLLSKSVQPHQLFSSQSSFKNLINPTLKSLRSQQKQFLIKCNLQELLLFQEKNKELTNKATMIRKDLPIVREQVDGEVLIKKKITKELAVTIKLVNWIYIANLLFYKRKAQLARSLRICFYVAKFVNKLKKTRKTSIQLVPNNTARIIYGLMPLTNLVASINYQRSINKSQVIVCASIGQLFSSLSINIMLDKSQEYIQIIKKSQLRFLSIYRNRIKLLTHFTNKSKTSLVKKHVHLNVNQNKFHNENIAHKLITIYLREQAIKYNDNIKEYFQQKNQRKRFIQFVNKEKIKNQTKYKTNHNSFRQKRNQLTKQLVIPDEPLFPQRRLFRNLPELKRMIRNWFQLQNQILIRQQKTKKQWYLN